MAVFEAVSHTVRLVVYVPIALASGDGWTWAALPGADPVGHEFVYTCEELARALRVWGGVIARTIAHVHDRFSIAAYGMVTGAIVGRDAWVRSAETHALQPHGEPWCVWDAQVAWALAQGIAVPAR